MEQLFRKNFWVINLAFLAAAAFLVARVANLFVEKSLMTPPELVTGQPEARKAAFAQPQRLSDAVLSRVTGIKLPEPEAKVKEVALENKPNLTAEPIHTGLKVKLKGTTVANRPEWSWAMIEDVVAKNQDSYMVGDKLQSAEVTLILDDCTEAVPSLPDPKPCVIIVNNGHREYVDEKEGNGPSAPPPTVAVKEPVANTDAPKPNDTGSGITSTGENSYNIPKQELEKALGDLNAIAMQARIVPAFKDGVATGFKLFSIRPDSLYSKIGIQNGDVIRRLNGFEINAPDKALEAYSKLREANRIELEVERNGSIVRKTYDIR